MNQDYEVSSTPPTEDEYAELREQAAADWPMEEEETPVEDAEYSVTVRKKNTQELVGFGSARKRYNGEALEYYDLLVKPDHQSNGIGSKITESIIEWSKQYLDNVDQPWIALRGKVRRGKNSYFEQFGFQTIQQDDKRNEIRMKIESS